MAEGLKNKTGPRARAKLRLVEPRHVPVRELSDEEAMLAHGRGSEEAFAELLRRHQRPIFNYICRMVQNRHIAEELTQDVFMALVRNAQRYRPTAKFTTYLYTIASNIVSKEWLRRKRRPRIFNFSALWTWRGNDGDEYDPLERVKDGRAAVLGDSQRIEVNEAVNEALKQLPQHQREAFVLRRLQDVPYQEIAEIANAPVGTIKSRVVRAERALRPLLERFREYMGPMG